MPQKYVTTVRIQKSEENTCEVENCGTSAVSILKMGK